MNLNPDSVATARVKRRPYKLFDGDGLYLLVQPSGSKYWRMKYRYAGKEKTLALGTFPDVSLKDARKGTQRARLLLEDDKDPSTEKRRTKLAKAGLGEFETIAREWYARRAPRLTKVHGRQVIKTLEADVFPVLGRQPIGDITAPEVLAIIQRIERRAPETAARVLQRVRAVFAYAIATGRAKANPAADLHVALMPRDERHQPALPAAELPEFLAKLEAYKGAPETRWGLRLVLLTLLRTSEVRAAEWSEIDLPGKVWSIPAERMKAKRPHRVPLSKQTVALLREIQTLTGGERFVFPGRREQCMSQNTMLYGLYRMGYHGRATVHGFRSLASTVLNEALDPRSKNRLWSPDAIERALAHAPDNEVRAAYDRGDRFPERVRMMQWWADYLDSQRAAAPD